MSRWRRTPQPHPVTHRPDPTAGAGAGRKHITFLPGWYDLRTRAGQALLAQVVATLGEAANEGRTEQSSAA